MATVSTVESRKRNVGSTGLIVDRLDHLVQLYSHSSSGHYVRTMTAIDICSPAPLGFIAFAFATAYWQAQQAGIIDDGAVYLAYSLGALMGGINLYVASFGSLLRRDTLGFTAFFMYGSYYLAQVYFHTLNAQGTFFLKSPKGEVALTSMFAIVSFFFVILSSVYNLILPILFGMICIMFSLNAAGSVVGKDDVLKAGGWFGIFTSAAALYCGVAFLIEDAAGFELLPIFWTKRAQVHALRLYPRISDNDRLSITHGVPFTGRWFGLLNQQNEEALSQPSLADLSAFRPPEIAVRDESE